jgi:hypothetical protein
MLCCDYGCRSTSFAAELKGKPAKIRYYPRSCKSLAPKALSIAEYPGHCPDSIGMGRLQQSGKSEYLPYHNLIKF